MNLKLIFLAALLASSISALSADALDEKQFQKLMKEVGDTTKRVKPGIESKDADQLNKDAARLAEIYKQTVPFWQHRKVDDAAKWSQESAAAASALALAAKAKDWDKATQHFRELGKNCKACHDAHREKLEDGSSRIK